MRKSDCRRQISLVNEVIHATVELVRQALSHEASSAIISQMKFKLQEADLCKDKELPQALQDPQSQAELS